MPVLPTQYVLFSALPKPQYNCLPHHIIELSHTCLVVADGTAKQCISFQCSAILCNWATVLHPKWQWTIFRHTLFAQEYENDSREISTNGQIWLHWFVLCQKEIQWESDNCFFLCNTRVDCVTDSKWYKIMVFCFTLNAVKQLYVTRYVLLKSKADNSQRNLRCSVSRPAENALIEKKWPIYIWRVFS